MNSKRKTILNLVNLLIVILILAHIHNLLMSYWFCFSRGSDLSVVDKYQTKLKDLKIMLECSRSRVKVNSITVKHSVIIKNV